MAITLKVIESRLNKAIAEMKRNGLHLLPTGLSTTQAIIGGEQCGCIMAAFPTQGSYGIAEKLGCSGDQVAVLIDGFEKNNVGVLASMGRKKYPGFYALGAKLRKRALNSAFAKRARARGWTP